MFFINIFASKKNDNVGLIILFFVLIFFIILFITGIFLYKPVRNALYSKKFSYYYYKKIYKVALYRDFYLINTFLFSPDGSNVCSIDHILFGDKYIYFIIDKYYLGDISGKENDKSLVFTPRKGRRAYTDNPLFTIDTYLKNLSMLTGLDKSLMIGVVMVNNDCHVSIQGDNNQCYIVQEKKFSSLIKAIESRDVGKFKEAELEKAVKSLDKMNRRRKNND